MIVGYARVSTDGQTLDAQQAALAEAGCAKVFAEKQSGAKTDRATLAKAIAALTAGDTLVVCKLDRLARSTRDLLNTLAAIAEAGRNLQVVGRSLGRYNECARQADGDRVGRPCRVRASLDPGSDKRC